MSMKCNQENAISICRMIESLAPNFGAHIGLTGGCLYKFEDRKDIDIVIYRIRQVEKIDFDGFFVALENLVGMKLIADHGFCKKVDYKGVTIDFLYPESASGDDY